MYQGLQKGLLYDDLRGCYKGLERGNYKGLYKNNAIIDRETIAWLQQVDKSGYPRPSWRYITCLNTLIVNLKQAGIWQLLDRFWVFATEHRGHARISIVNPTAAALTEVNSPSWTRYHGYQSDGVSSYLNTNYNPVTQGVNFTMNNHKASFYVRSVEQQPVTFDFGSSDGTNLLGGIADDDFQGINQAQIYDCNGSSTSAYFANTPATGLYSFYRTTNTSLGVYQRGINLTLNTGSGSTTAIVIPSLSLYISCINSTGTSATNFASRQYGLFSFGSANINEVIYYKIIQNFSVKIGFNV